MFMYDCESSLHLSSFQRMENNLSHGDFSALSLTNALEKTVLSFAQLQWRKRMWSIWELSMDALNTRGSKVCTGAGFVGKENR